MSGAAQSKSAQWKAAQSKAAQLTVAAVAAGALTVLSEVAAALPQGSGPAAGAPSDQMTVDGSSSSVTVTHNEQLSLQGTAQRTCDPKVGVGKRTVAISLRSSAGDRTLTARSVSCRRSTQLVASLDTSHAANGRYVATLTNGSRQTSTAFDLRIAPAPPAHFAATASGTRADFAWQANPEPDIERYVISDRAGSVADGDVSPAAHCTNGSCSVTVGFGPSAAGTRRSFVVRAVRCGDSCAPHDRLPGPDSAVDTVSFPAPSTPAPQPTDGGDEGSGANGGSYVAQSAPPPADTPTATSAGSATASAGVPAPLTTRHRTTHPQHLPPVAGATPTASPQATFSTAPSAAAGGTSLDRSGWSRLVAAVVILLLLVSHLVRLSRRSRT